MMNSKSTPSDDTIAILTTLSNEPPSQRTTSTMESTSLSKKKNESSAKILPLSVSNEPPSRTKNQNYKNKKNNKNKNNNEAFHQRQVAPRHARSPTISSAPAMMNSKPSPSSSAKTGADAETTTTVSKISSAAKLSKKRKNESSTKTGADAETTTSVSKISSAAKLFKKKKKNESCAKTGADAETTNGDADIGIGEGEMKFAKKITTTKPAPEPSKAAATSSTSMGMKKLAPAPSKDTLLSVESTSLSKKNESSAKTGAKSWVNNLRARSPGSDITTPSKGKPKARPPASAFAEVDIFRFSSPPPEPTVSKISSAFKNIFSIGKKFPSHSTKNTRSSSTKKKRSKLQELALDNSEGGDSLTPLKDADSQGKERKEKQKNRTSPLKGPFPKEIDNKFKPNDNFRAANYTPKQQGAITRSKEQLEKGPVKQAWERTKAMTVSIASKSKRRINELDCQSAPQKPWSKSKRRRSNDYVATAFGRMLNSMAKIEEPERSIFGVSLENQEQCPKTDEEHYIRMLKDAGAQWAKNISNGTPKPGMAQAQKLGWTKDLEFLSSFVAEYFPGKGTSSSPRWSGSKHLGQLLKKQFDEFLDLHQQVNLLPTPRGSAWTDQEIKLDRARNALQIIFGTTRDAKVLTKGQQLQPASTSHDNAKNSSFTKEAFTSTSTSNPAAANSERGGTTINAVQAETSPPSDTLESPSHSIGGAKNGSIAETKMPASPAGEPVNATKIPSQAKGLTKATSIDAIVDVPAAAGVTKMPAPKTTNGDADNDVLAGVTKMPWSQAGDPVDGIARGEPQECGGATPQLKVGSILGNNTGVLIEFPVVPEKHYPFRCVKECLAQLLVVKDPFILPREAKISNFESECEEFVQNGEKNADKICRRLGATMEMKFDIQEKGFVFDPLNPLSDPMHVMAVVTTEITATKPARRCFGFIRGKPGCFIDVSEEEKVLTTKGNIEEWEFKYVRLLKEYPLEARKKRNGRHGRPRGKGKKIKALEESIGIKSIDSIPIVRDIVASTPSTEDTTTRILKAASTCPFCSQEDPPAAFPQKNGSRAKNRSQAGDPVDGTGAFNPVVTTILEGLASNNPSKNHIAAEQYRNYLDKNGSFDFQAQALIFEAASTCPTFSQEDLPAAFPGYTDEIVERERLELTFEGFDCLGRKGIVNVGNTCYINAPLQMLLAALGPRMATLVATAYTYNHNDFEIAKLLCQIFRQMATGFVLADERLLSRFKALLFKSETFRVDGAKEDAQQDARLTLEAIICALGNLTLNNESNLNLLDSLGLERPCQKVEVVCTNKNCSGARDLEDIDITFIPLGVQAESIPAKASLQFLVNVWTNAEGIPDECHDITKLPCSVCRHATRRIEVLKNKPPVLIGHLVRERYLQEKSLEDKDNKDITMQEIVTFKDGGVLTHYACTGFAIHLGLDTRAGHWVSVINTQGGWVLFDDKETLPLGSWSEMIDHLNSTFYTVQAERVHSYNQGIAYVLLSKTDRAPSEACASVPSSTIGDSKRMVGVLADVQIGDEKRDANSNLPAAADMKGDGQHSEEGRKKDNTQVQHQQDVMLLCTVHPPKNPGDAPGQLISRSLFSKLQRKKKHRKCYVCMQKEKDGPQDVMVLCTVHPPKNPGDAPGRLLSRNLFSKSQLRKKETHRKCKVCIVHKHKERRLKAPRKQPEGGAGVLEETAFPPPVKPLLVPVKQTGVARKPPKARIKKSLSTNTDGSKNAAQNCLQQQILDPTTLGAKLDPPGLVSNEDDTIFLKRYDS